MVVDVEYKTQLADRLAVLCPKCGHVMPYVEVKRNTAKCLFPSCSVYGLVWEVRLPEAVVVLVSVPEEQ